MSFDPVKLFTGLDTIPGMKADVWLVNLYKLRAIAAGLKQEDGKKLNRMLEDSVIEPVERLQIGAQVWQLHHNLMVRLECV